MKTTSIKSYLTAAVLTIAGLSSCQKEKVTPPTTHTVTPVNNHVAVSTNTYKEIQAVLNSVMTGSYKKESALGGCAVVTNDTTVTPHVAIVDYGTGCTNDEGKFRSGRIVIQYDANDQTLAGNNVYASFENFHMDTLQIIGTLHEVINAPNGSGNTTISFSFPSQIVNDNTSDTASLTLSMDYEWLVGSGTRLRDDDQFDITGSIAGTDFGGNPCSETITSALRKNYDPRCNYFTQGVVEIRIAGRPDRTMDYGNGSCSGLVTITENGTSTVEHQ